MLHRLQPYAPLIKQIILYYRHTPGSPGNRNPEKTTLIFCSYLQKMLDKENYHHLTRTELKYIIGAVDWYAAARPDASAPLREIQAALQELLKKRSCHALLYLPPQIPR